MVLFVNQSEKDILHSDFPGILHWTSGNYVKEVLFGTRSGNYVLDSNFPIILHWILGKLQ